MAAVAVAVVVVGCSRGAEPPAIAVPARAATAGDALLALAPGGATWTLELDLARLRANPVVGATVAALVDGEATAPLPEVASARGAEQVVLVGYASGSPAAHTITLVRGGVAPAAAVAVADGVWAIADEGAVAGLVAVAPGASAADDVELAVVRSRAMPAGAEGAALRLAARLDDDARRALGAALELTEPPRALSAWLDVADDLALIVWQDGGDPRALVGWRDRLAATAEVRALGLAPSLVDAAIARRGEVITATVVIGPRRLARAVGRWQAGREAPP